MPSLIVMLAPFVVTGTLFVTAALLWARYKGDEVSQKEIGSDDLERGGGT